MALTSERHLEVENVSAVCLINNFTKPVSNAKDSELG